jgi:hypothetical protein
MAQAGRVPPEESVTRAQTFEVASDADLVMSIIARGHAGPRAPVALVVVILENKLPDSKCDTCTEPRSPRESCCGIL